MRFGPIPFPPVPLYATFNAKINAFADFSVGFDTRGIAKTGSFIDGFYFGDLANVTSGQDIDEFGIGVEAAVGALIDLGIAQAGIEGGVRADLAFNWNDLDKDGKIYLDELVDLFSLYPTLHQEANRLGPVCLMHTDRSRPSSAPTTTSSCLAEIPSVSPTSSYSNSIITAQHRDSVRSHQMAH